MDIKINLNINATVERLNKATEKAVFITSQQALKDSNYYCKKDQDALISSSETNSDFKNGRLIWKTPYARRQYYLDAAKHDINPHARKMWAHYAKSIHGEEWRKVFQRAFNKFSRE